MYDKVEKIIHLDVKDYRGQHELPEGLRHNTTGKVDLNSDAFSDFIRHGYAQLEAHIAAEQSVNVPIKYPKTGKDAFKKYIIEEKTGKRFPKFAKWFLKKYPIEYHTEVLEQHIIHPEILIEEGQRYVQYRKLELSSSSDFTANIKTIEKY